MIYIFIILIFIIQFNYIYSSKNNDNIDFTSQTFSSYYYYSYSYSYYNEYVSSSSTSSSSGSNSSEEYFQEINDKKYNEKHLVYTYTLIKDPAITYYEKLQEDKRKKNEIKKNNNNYNIKNKKLTNENEDRKLSFEFKKKKSFSKVKDEHEYDYENNEYIYENEANYYYNKNLYDWYEVKINVKNLFLHKIILKDIPELYDSFISAHDFLSNMTFDEYKYLVNNDNEKRKLNEYVKLDEFEKNPNKNIYDENLKNEIKRELDKENFNEDKNIYTNEIEKNYDKNINLSEVSLNFNSKYKQFIPMIYRNKKFYLNNTLSSSFFTSKPVYISITTIDKRIKSAYYSIKTILTGSIIPTKIFLFISSTPYLSDKGIKKIPTSLLSLVAEGVLRIIYTNNLGPHRKLLPLLNKFYYKDANIITIDDDMTYNKYDTTIKSILINTIKSSLPKDNILYYNIIKKDKNANNYYKLNSFFVKINETSSHTLSKTHIQMNFQPIKGVVSLRSRRIAFCLESSDGIIKNNKRILKTVNNKLNREDYEIDEQLTNYHNYNNNNNEINRRNLRLGYSDLKKKLFTSVYESWPLSFPSYNPLEHLILPTGTGGILYHPTFFHPIIFNKEFHKVTEATDDIQFRFATLISDTPIITGCKDLRNRCNNDKEYIKLNKLIEYMINKINSNKKLYELYYNYMIYYEDMMDPFYLSRYEFDENIKTDLLQELKIRRKNMDIFLERYQKDEEDEYIILENNNKLKKKNERLNNYKKKNIGSFEVDYLTNDNGEERNEYNLLEKNNQYNNINKIEEKQRYFNTFKDISSKDDDFTSPDTIPRYLKNQDYKEVNREVDKDSNIIKNLDSIKDLGDYHFKVTNQILQKKKIKLNESANLFVSNESNIKMNNQISNRKLFLDQNKLSIDEYNSRKLSLFHDNMKFRNNISWQNSIKFLENNNLFNYKKFIIDHYNERGPICSLLFDSILENNLHSLNFYDGNSKINIQKLLFICGIDFCNENNFNSN